MLCLTCGRAGYPLFCFALTFSLALLYSLMCHGRGPLLAWASEGGLKIMDVDKGKAGERISYVDK